MSDFESGIKSKSQQKRAHLELQALGKTLVELPESLLKRLPLSARLRDEVMAGRKLQRGALQRQLRYLAGVLEREDHAMLRAALKAAQEPGLDEIRRLHELEALRDALLRDGDLAIESLSGRFPDVDRTQLRQLVRNARQEHAQGLTPRASRELFRFLKQLTARWPATDASRVDP